MCVLVPCANAVLPKAVPEVLDDPNGSYGPVVSMPDNGVEALDEEERPPEEAADTSGMTLSTNLLINTVFAYCYVFTISQS